VTTAGQSITDALTSRPPEPPPGGVRLALVPLGVRVLRDGPPLSRCAVFWIVVCVAINVAGLVLARLFPVLNN